MFSKESPIFAMVMLQSFVTGIGDRLRRDEEGATAVEYGLLVALIAAIIIAVVAVLGTEIRDAFQTVCTRLNGDVACAQ